MGEELEKIKPCPFCGAEAVTRRVFISMADYVWVIGCDGVYWSDCPGYIWKLAPGFLTEEQAIRTWNRRVCNNA